MNIKKIIKKYWLQEKNCVTFIDVEIPEYCATPVKYRRVYTALALPCLGPLAPRRAVGARHDALPRRCWYYIVGRMNSRESPARTEGTTGSQRPSVRTMASLILLEDVGCGQVWRGVVIARRHFPRHASWYTAKHVLLQQIIMKAVN